VLAALLALVSSCRQPPQGGRRGEKVADSASRPAAGHWATFRGDQGLTGYVAQRPPPALRVRWRYNAQAPIESAPVVAGTLAYVGCNDGNLHAVSLSDGKGVWSLPADDAITAPPLVVDEAVYVGTRGGDFLCVDAASGQLRWQIKADDAITGAANYWRIASQSAPAGAAAAPWIIFGSQDSTLYCVRADNGDTVWTFKADSYINGAPAVVGNLAVFGACDNLVRAVDIPTGAEVGRASAGGFVAGCPAAMPGGAVVFGAYGGTLTAWLPGSSGVLWTLGLGVDIDCSPAVSTGRVVIGMADGAVVCTDLGGPSTQPGVGATTRPTPRVLWRFAARGAVTAPPVIAGDRVIVASEGGEVYVLSLDRGRRLWSYRTGGAVVAAPALAAGLILVASKDGVLYAFGAP
jgi:outer membrane protein assembly factor BamB